MAVRAKAVGVDVTGALSLGGRAIVTAHTITRHTGMVEHGRGPGRRRAVAVAARRRGLNMGRALALRVEIIVATGAADVGLGVIELNNRPVAGRVTAITGQMGGDVANRHAGRHVVVVTPGALARRTAELAGRMTGLATDEPVGVVQGKAGIEVIEPGGRRRQGRRRRQRGRDRPLHLRYVRRGRQPWLGNRGPGRALYIDRRQLIWIIRPRRIRGAIARRRNMTAARKDKNRYNCNKGEFRRRIPKSGNGGANVFTNVVE